MSPCVDAENRGPRLCTRSTPSSPVLIYQNFFPDSEAHVAADQAAYPAKNSFLEQVARLTCQFPDPVFESKVADHGVLNFTAADKSFTTVNRFCYNTYRYVQEEIKNRKLPN